jgi:hypothetical protein
MQTTYGLIHENDSDNDDDDDDSIADMSNFDPLPALPQHSLSLLLVSLVSRSMTRKLSIS